MPTVKYMTALVALSIPLAVACGGGQSEVNDPSSKQETEQPAAPEPKPAKPAAEESAGEPAESGTPMRNAQDIITAPDVVFMFSFNDSEPMQVAEKTCAEKSGDDPKKNADCMAAARKKFKADVFQFKQDDDGSWVWLTMRKKGNTLQTLQKTQVEFTDVTEKSITIKPVGKNKSMKEVVLEVPNDSQIVVTDPKHGKLVYTAKIGIVGAQER